MVQNTHQPDWYSAERTPLPSTTYSCNHISFTYHDLNSPNLGSESNCAWEINQYVFLYLSLYPDPHLKLKLQFRTDPPNKFRFYSYDSSHMRSRAHTGRCLPYMCTMNQSQNGDFLTGRTRAAFSTWCDHMKEKAEMKMNLFKFSVHTCTQSVWFLFKSRRYSLTIDS